jgi:tRNA pseudouridine55 synthase
MKQAARIDAGRERSWRSVDGVLLLDKRPGITSSAAVQRVRRLFRARKAGHTGTLDPMATGLLPVCLGEATKFSHVLLDADKSYLATIRLGVTTNTGDVEGEVTGRHVVRTGIEDVERALSGFIGEIQQTPPMYSALKRGGQPLYKLARAGTDVPRAPRKVVVHALDVLGLEGNELRIRVRCSKGTYVRVLAEDLGRALGCGACLAGLRREGVGGFRLSSGAVTLDRLEETAPADREALLLPSDVLVTGLPRLDLDSGAALRLSHGQPVAPGTVAAAGLARIYGPGGTFLGVAEVKSHGEIVPRRLIATPSPQPVTGQVSLEKPWVRE